MKNLIAFLVSFAVVGSYVNAQNCVPNTIIFATQSDVDAFPTNYPGCTTIEGNVGITGSVSNLDSLSQITKIGGTLSIQNASNQLTFSGLNNLEEIGMDLVINNIVTNNTFTGLNALAKVGRDFNIPEGSFNTINGLFALDSVKRDFTFRTNNVTNGLNLAPMTMLSYVGRNVVIGGASNIGNVNSFDTIRGNLTIRDLYSNDFPDFPMLKRINGDFNIFGNPNIIKVDNLNQLNSIGGLLWIYFNAKLFELSGLTNLTSIGSNLTIEDNALFNNLVGLNHPISINNNITITGNPFLFDCDIIPICQRAWQNNNTLNINSNGSGCSSILEIQQTCPSPPDQDGDGIIDLVDNCIAIPNQNQLDNDGDGIGNVCDPDYDEDNDGIVNVIDNCDLVSNPNQADINNDGEGDACDFNSDYDMDGVVDANDNCIAIPNAMQEDASNNGIGDACEDTDFDGILDISDNCIFTYNPGQADIDNDGIGDICEPNSLCGSGIIILSNQQQVDNFKKVYPGCTIIDGSMVITGSVENVDSLHMLTQVINNLSINGGLVNDILGLNGLTHIGASLTVVNSSISNWDVFNNLDKVGLDLTIDCKELPGFSTLDSVGGKLKLQFFQNLSVPNVVFNSMNDLKFIGNDLEILTNWRLTINGFQNLNKIGGSLNFSNNTFFGHLLTVNSFNNLVFVGNDINTTGGYLSFTGLNNVTKVNNLILEYLVDFNGFNSLDSILNNCKISGVDISNVSLGSNFNVSYFGGNVELTHLVNIGGINNLDTIRGNLYLNYFTNPNSITFPNLKEIKGSFILNGCSFPIFNGMNNLKKVNGDFSIGNYNEITTILGFQQLIELKTLSIRNNYYLNDLSGLNHAINFLPSTTFFKIDITANPFLQTCSIIPICNAINQGIPTIIDNNSLGCNSISEIAANCPIVPDSDGDTVNDLLDNCVNIANTNQADANNDGEGDKCDSNSDTDNDTKVDSIDNCVSTFNPDQADANSDGEGDVCDTNSDSDGDGAFDYVDNCPTVANPDQKDCNGNGVGDICENFVDADCDAIIDVADNCPSLFNPAQIDYNNNGIGDACEVFPKIGFNNSDPKSEFHLSYSNLYIDHPEKGLILKGSNGNCYRTEVVVIAGQAQLKMVAIPCPQ